MAAPDKVHELVERFDYNFDSYNSGKYNETQVRREFIDPFFKELGWDIDNEQGYAEAYKDVIHEDAIKIGGFTKAPDYCFRVGGTRKFFLEAKKPSVNIKDAPHPAFQLRRYAWSAKLPLSILTDFEELAVYDCRIKPEKTDKASTARTIYMTFRDYAERWDELVEIFARDSILKGSFDKYAESTKKKRGTAEVDDAFLDEIESWRLLLAKNIALRNPSLTRRELNSAVQKTIDRLIFLRICEDRGIEPYGRLRDLQKRKDVYGELRRLFQNADDRYNSGLFHFTKEKNRPEEPDTFTLGLTIDDKPLKDILKGLYYPDSPYEFSVLPADILGQVYEQFLGKVITLKGKSAVVEEKPEVKKAGGVYYTPTYIVDYIVEHTVGKLVEVKTPRQISDKTKTPPLRILDPACGSGTFLIGAYQYLLDWHLKWYLENDPEKQAKGQSPKIYQGQAGDWRLTTDERKRILLTHIYGVDIDAQAVEVTKLSLLLKVLEGENNESINQQIQLFQKRVLPDLGSNIKCGNSLIGSDFYVNMEVNLFDEEERYRINIFDWEDEFPKAFVDGGFDAVIGNPPYIRIQALKEFAPKEVEFYKTKYEAASKGNYDIYVAFIERCLHLMSSKGKLGFILPHKFFNNKFGEPIRNLIAQGSHLSEVVHFGDEQVFKNATTYTCLLFLEASPTDELVYRGVNDLAEWRISKAATEGIVSSSVVDADEWNFVVGDGAELYNRLAAFPLTLEDVTDRIFQGFKTGADKIYIVDEVEREDKLVKIYSRQNGQEYCLEQDLLNPLIKGGDSRNFRFTKTNRLILFPYTKSGNAKSRLLSSEEIAEQHPKTWTYLKSHQSYLENRERGKMKGEGWYGFSRNQALDVMPQPKIFTPDIAQSSAFTLDVSGDIFFTGGVSGGYGIVIKPEYSCEFILGLLNSKLLNWFNTKVSTQMRGGYWSFESKYISRWPICQIDGSKKVKHDQIVDLVHTMIEVSEQVAASKTAQDRKLIRRQRDAIERKINHLTYELYDLTPEEIAVVEEQQ